MLVACAAMAFCGLAQAGGHNDKGGIDPGQFVGDSHGQTFENTGNDHNPGQDNGNGKDVGNHYDGGIDHGYGGGGHGWGGDKPPVCDPPPVSTVPESSTLLMMSLGGVLLAVYSRRKRYASHPRVAY